MKTILVPCDFSKPALAAYRQALDVAAQSRGVVHLLHVIEPPLLNDSGFVPPINYAEELMIDLQNNAERMIKDIIGQNTKKIKTMSEVQFGAVTPCIIDYIKKHKIDLVMMGSNGASGFKEFVFGSNAERVVRKSPVPVLVVKEYYKAPIKNIVFPNELDIDNQDSLIHQVKELQKFFKAKLHLLWINTPAVFVADNTTKKRLEDFAKQYKLTDYTVNVFNYISVEEGIYEFANSIHADMIAVGTHSRKGLSHLMNGSIAEDVANHSRRLIWTCTLKNELAATH